MLSVDGYRSARLGCQHYGLDHEEFRPLLRCHPASVELPVSRTPTSPAPRKAFTPALTDRAADRLSSEDEAQLFEREFAPFPDC
jgi:hypothetical protein